MNLTFTEREVLDHLADAWNAFASLDRKSEHDADEFHQAIHAAQQLIALRVARRVDPDIWNQPQ